MHKNMGRTTSFVLMSMMGAWALLLPSHGFLVRTAILIPQSDSLPSKKSHTTAVLENLGMYNHIIDSTAASTTSLTIASEEWRQYLSLAVVAGVLLDILLGSPLANAVLKPLRGAQEVLTKEGNDGGDMNNSSGRARSKERIDSEKVAQQAIDKAQNMLELKNYLESRKTDWDRMEDMKRNLDKTMQDIDDDLKARQEFLDKQSK
jgi:hypothetical protein